MRRKPKYNIGDIIEFWDKELPEMKFLITDIRIIKNCTKKKCSMCKRNSYTYFVKPINMDTAITFALAREVDMVEWNRQTVHCNFGWRRIG